MSPQAVSQRYRTFLLAVSTLVFAGTAVELVLIEHTGSTVQWLPFVFCGLGLGSTLAMLYTARRATLLASRAVAALVVAGSLFGVYEHLTHNWSFAAEIHPSASQGALFWEMLKGASPVMAPGALALAAVLAAAATYQHPALRKPEEETA